MKVASAIFALALLCSVVWAEPCQSSGGNNALHSAALGLGAGEWCKVAPNVEGGATVKQLLTTCLTGNTDWIQSYASSMGYDEANQVIHFFGTPHGGAAGQVKYVVSTNTWTAEESITPPVCSTASCPAGAPWNATLSACSQCTAYHAYDSNAVDGDGNLWYAKFGTAYLQKFNGTAWSVNHTECPGGMMSTGGIAYWPSLGASGSLIMECDYAQETWRFDLRTETWAKLGNTPSSGNGNYHQQIEYHPVADQIWIQSGNGAQEHYRLWLDGGAPAITRLGNAPSGRLGMTTSKCVADPASEDTFVCWSLSEDSIGSTSAGWYAYDLSDNSWSSFSSQGISSMPPLYTHAGDIGSTPVTHAAIPEYGVVVWLAQRTDEGDDNGGMYVYRHSEGGDPAGEPELPRDLRAE